MSHIDFGVDLLTDCHKRISVNSLLRKALQTYKESLMNDSISINNQDLKLTTSKTGNGGTRLWFSCPICKKRVGDLYQHPFSQDLGCRKCFRMKYRSSSKKGMVEGRLNMD